MVLRVKLLISIKFFLYIEKLYTKYMVLIKIHKCFLQVKSIVLLVALHCCRAIPRVTDGMCLDFSSLEPQDYQGSYVQSTVLGVLEIFWLPKVFSKNPLFHITFPSTGQLYIFLNYYFTWKLRQIFYKMCFQKVFLKKQTT